MESADELDKDVCEVNETEEETGLEDITDDDEEDDDDDDDEDEDESDDDGDGDGDSEEGSGENDEVDDDETDHEEADDDEDDDDEAGDDDADDEAVLEASDSDGEGADRCPICLDRFRDQDVGSPEACDHHFCLECIQEWSMNVNTCPVDRQVFKLILCKHGIDDVIYKKIPVEDKNAQADEEEEDEVTYCEVCHECNREDRLLLCDGCDLGYHLECLTPPLRKVPVQEWFCPGCSTREGISSDADEDYVPEMALNRRPLRQVARTSVMERVRTAIEEMRVRRTRNQHRIVSSDEEEHSMGDTAPAATSSSSSAASPTKKPAAKKTTTKRKTPRKYKKRKTIKKTKTTKKTPRKRKTTKRKRKVKRKGKKGRRGKRTKRLARTAKPSPVTTVKTRIAGALGLIAPPPGRTIPMQKLKTEKTLDMKRSDIGASTLSIFGSRDQIIGFEDELVEQVEQVEQSTNNQSTSGASGTRKYSRLALSSYKPIGRVPTVVPVRGKKIVIKAPTSGGTLDLLGTTTGASGGALDLLGTIMQDQNRLHMSSKEVTIQRDGSLTSKRTETSTKNAQKSSSTQSLFKSSFTAVESMPEKRTSVLSSISSKEYPESPEKQISLTEEYDPAHPTDEIEEVVSDASAPTEIVENVYDPAHPTHDLNSEDEMIDEHALVGNSGSKEPMKVKIGKVTGTEAKVGMDINKVTTKLQGTDYNTKCIEISNIKDNAKFSKTVIDQAKTGTASCIIKTSAIKKEPGTSIKMTRPDIPIAKLQITREKILPVDKNEKEDTLKKSPNVKITETSKKNSPVVKPFEISRKSLFEKRRLYGGEIDFSQDVDFSEGAFPETFELSVKRIEEVFKGTKVKTEPKSIETENKNTETKQDNLAVEKEPLDTVSANIDEEKVENAEKEKAEREKAEKVKSNNDIKEKLETEISNKPNKENKIDNQDSVKVKAVKDQNTVIVIGKFKPISASCDDNIGTTKISVGDRFKKMSQARKIPEITNLEEEDPIHEMRKLDKELDLEFGNSNFRKKKEKDKETKKSKRKVSIEDNESELIRHRRESKENREKRKSDTDKYGYEKEEGEVEEEYRVKEKKKRDKKRRRVEKERDRYLDNDYKGKIESDIDRRIVIQVSQNTDDRTVWEEAERQRKKRDREERKRDKERVKESEKDIRREKKRRRQRSRSRSHERRNKSRSRDRRRSRSRDRNRSRDRARRKRRERSRSGSRDWSHERSRKKKKRGRNRSREWQISRSRSRDRSRGRDISRERDWSVERGRGRSRGRSRDRKRSRDLSEDAVDIFGRSRSPYTRREFLKNKQHLTPRKKKIPLRVDEVIEILDTTPPKKSTYDEVSSSDSEKEAEHVTEKIETISRIEVKHRSSRVRPAFVDTGEKDEEFDDEPEETEQFQYTDRDEYLGQNKSKQMRQNLITIGVSSNDYDPANPTGASSPAQPPLPEPIPTPTPPLPPGGDFTQFPPPPPGPPPRGPHQAPAHVPPQGPHQGPPPGPHHMQPQGPLLGPPQGPSHLPPHGPHQGPPPGPPPGGVIIQEHPTTCMQIQTSRPPGPGIIGDGPIHLQGPPPTLEGGPPPGLIQQRPAMSVPMNINVMPPGFHRGLPPTITPQRQMLANPLRSAAPGIQRLTGPGGGIRFRWQVSTPSEVIPSRFGSRIPSSPVRLSGPLINGPFDGLPPPHTEAPPPHSLPPGHARFPPPSGDPPPHVITIKTSTPPPNVIQIPIEVNDSNTHIHPPGPEPQLIHLGPDTRGPPPRLPIPLLPPTSEPPPMSVMVSIPPPNSSLMSLPPPGNRPEPFPRSDTPPNSVSAILGLARMGAGSMPIVSSAVIPRLTSATMVNGDGPIATSVSNSDMKTESSLNEFEKISALLGTRAQLMSQDREVSPGKERLSTGKCSLSAKIHDVFKIPHVPMGKSGGKPEVDATEVVDMDMGSPINEEGNIELPLSPQFDNLIDNPEDLLEEDFNKKMQKLLEKASANKTKHKDKSVSPMKKKDVKSLESKKDSPLKTKDEKHKHSSKANKHDRSGHKSHRHKSKREVEKDLKEDALNDAHLDLDSQEVPSSAVDMTNKEKYLKKLHLQERVVEEVKMAIKPFYSAKKITKVEYKEILRKAVPKICHSKSGNINPNKIKSLVAAYVEKYGKQSSYSPESNYSPGDGDLTPDIQANGGRQSATNR